MEIKKTSKRILTCTLAALMLAGAAVSMPAVIPQSTLTVSAAQTYGDFEYEVKNNKVTITSYTGKGGAVTIPSTINGKSVTSIGDAAFLFCNSLKTISIPDSVTNIGNNAFNGCESLKTISIPNGVKGIGKLAFESCNSLKTISIPDSVTNIGNNPFASCDNLTNINVSSANKNYCTYNGVLYNKNKTTLICCPGAKSNISIPSGVTSISRFAFAGCDSLKTISIPNGVKSIESFAFADCDSLKTISIPNGVKSIEYAAFSNCNSLKTISIPDSVTNIGNKAFNGCESLKTISIQNGVKSIEDAAFAGCDSLKTISIPDSVTNIGESTFYYCKNLKNITIPDSVTFIGSYAFFECVNLKSVFIPKSVKEIGVYSFGFYEKSKSGNAEGIAKIDNFVIKGEKGSEAEKYAKANGFKFVAGAAPSSVTLNKTAMSLGKSETTKLTATVAPSNAADKTVTWRTSNSKVLTVDKNGNVKAAGTGTAWITAKTINGKEKSCKITVKSAPSKVTISKGTVTIGVGEKFTVGSAVPNGSAAAKRTYRTSNSSVVKMTRTDWQGDFVGVKPGTAYVTVKTYNGKESACKVTVRPAPSSVTVSKKSMTLKVGQTASLSCSVPSGSGCASRTFRTSNSSVVKMTKTNWTGSFKAVKPGTAYVTVRTYNGKEASCKITVTK